MKKKFKKEDIIECLWEGESNDLKLVEEGDWIAEYKYECCDVIFKDLKTEKTFLYPASRSGSPFTDWYYSWEDEPEEIECSEVEKIEVVTYKWKIMPV